MWCHLTGREEVSVFYEFTAIHIYNTLFSNQIALCPGYVITRSIITLASNARGQYGILCSEEAWVQVLQRCTSSGNSWISDTKESAKLEGLSYKITNLAK